MLSRDRGPYSRWSARYCYDTLRRRVYPLMGGLITVKIQVTNATIALDEVGEGTPVLLLHGFPATRHLWSHVVPLLRNSGYRLLVPDLVGYGESEAPAGVGVDMASQAHWMLQLLDTLGYRRGAACQRRPRAGPLGGARRVSVD